MQRNVSYGSDLLGWRVVGRQSVHLFKGSRQLLRVVRDAGLGLRGNNSKRVRSRHFVMYVASEHAVSMRLTVRLDARSGVRRDASVGVVGWKFGV